MKVEYLIKPMDGTENKKQSVTITEDGKVFQSYNTRVCKIDNDGNISIGKTWNDSITTRKYLYQFLKKYAGQEGLNQKKVMYGLEHGEYTLVESI